MAARGGLLKLLDAYIAIGGDAADFDKVVDQSEAKAKAAGGRLESAFSPRKVLGALGTAAGAVLGVTLGVAGQLDAAMRQLQSDTGMTDAQAKAAEHSLAGMAKNNLQSFDEIGAAMAVVHNELGLVGAAADAATERFLRYATATGQSAAPAASDFAQILKAFNLDASETPAIMDKLIASHQVYGTVVTEDQAALVAMAPALDAMNMGVDDGIALLNLFQAAGIDAAKAPMALAKAMKELKPGQNINDLIAQISSIQDPTLRAQEAIRIFGVRGGVQLAQAFQPGITSLDQFATSAEQNAAATDKAAAAIESGFGEKFKLILNNAKATLAEFGTGFGDLIGIAQLVGPGITRALLAGLGGLAGFFGPKLLALILPEGIAAGTTAGAATGRAFGLAIGPALALAIPAAIIIGLEVAKPTIQKWLDDMGLHVPNLFEGQGALAPPGQIVPVGTQTTYAEGNAAAHEAAMKEAGASDAAAIAAGLASGAPKMLAASKDLGYNVLNGFLGPLQFSPDKIFAIFGSSLAGLRRASATTGADAMLAMAQGIESARAKPLDAFTTMVEMLKHQMSAGAEAARLAGELTSKALADGLHSADPEVRAQATAVRRAAIDRLATLASETGSIGKKAMAELDAGIRSKIPGIRTTSIVAKVAVMKELGKTASEAGPAGRAAMDQLDAGIRSKVPAIHDAAVVAKAAAVSVLNGAAVPARAAGVSAGAAFAAGIVASLQSRGLPTSLISRLVHQAGDPGRASGGPVTAGYPYIVNENTPRSEWFVPAVSGTILTADQAAGQGLGRGGPTYNVTVNNPEPRAAGPDIGRVLRRTAALGMTS